MSVPVTGCMEKRSGRLHCPGKGSGFNNFIPQKVQNPSYFCVFAYSLPHSAAKAQDGLTIDMSTVYAEMQNEDKEGRKA